MNVQNPCWGMKWTWLTQQFALCSYWGWGCWTPCVAQSIWCPHECYTRYQTLPYPWAYVYFQMDSSLLRPKSKFNLFTSYFLFLCLILQSSINKSYSFLFQGWGSVGKNSHMLYFCHTRWKNGFKYNKTIIFFISIISITNNIKRERKRRSSYWV